jgi:hypothetical protein
VTRCNATDSLAWHAALFSGLERPTVAVVPLDGGAG